MAKTTRSEAWHLAYDAIYHTFNTTRLNIAQVSVCMNVPTRFVRTRYPYGWINMSGEEGKGRNNTIRLDALLDQEYGVY